MAVAFNVNLNMSKTNQTSLLALANVEALANNEGGGSNWICSTYTSTVEDEYTEDCYDANNERVRKIFQRFETRKCNSGWFSFCYPGEIFTSFDCDGSANVTDNTKMSTCS